MSSNPPETITELLWTYRPPDYFEVPVTVGNENYLIEIGAGQIIIRANAGYYDSTPNLYASLRNQVTCAFRGALPFRRRPFEIVGGQIFRIGPDGQRRFIGATAHFSLIVTPAYSDTSTDPERVKNLAQLSAQYAAADPTVGRMLDSFDAALQYPESVLVYLYEVWDALQTRFRKNKRNLRKLSISRPDRSRLTRLANKEPLHQGRHRGQFAGRLRSVTDDELDVAWTIAGRMFESYLNYLEAQEGRR